MTPEQEAAAEMRDRIIEAAFNEKVDGNVSDYDLTYNRAIDHVVAAVRNLPLPEAKPDPRDAALAIADAALKRLSILGNGSQPGNSHGNVIAQEALSAIESALKANVP